MDKWFDVITVRDIKRAIDGLSDDRHVMFQVVARDGTAWLMSGDITRNAFDDKPVVVRLTHPMLDTLNDKNGAQHANNE